MLGLCSSAWAFSSCSVQASHCGSLSSCGAQSLGHMRFSSCDVWARQVQLEGSRGRAHELCLTGSADPRPVGSSWTRDGSNVPCIARRIINHWITREAHMVLSTQQMFSEISIHLLNWCLCTNVPHKMIRSLLGIQ